MAACAYCGRDISYNATRCPQCGHIVSSSDYDGGSYGNYGGRRWGTMVGLLVALVSAVAMISSVLRETSDASFTSSVYAWLGFGLLWLPLAFACLWIGSKIDGD
jgi:hypothetical protein